MHNQDEIKEFSRLLDLLAVGRNVSSKGNLDPTMVQIACTLANTDLSGLSQNRDLLRRNIGQRQSMRPAGTGRRPQRQFSLLAAFSMGFATMIALAYVSLVILMPLVQHTGRDPSAAGAPIGTTTINALLAAVKHLASPTATPSPTSTVPDASPMVLPGWTSTPRPTDTVEPPTPSLTPTWTPTPTPLSAPGASATWTSTPLPSWSPPERVDSILTVQGDAGTVEHFSAPLPSANGATSSIIQVIVNIPQAEGDAGRRRVDYALTCAGAGANKLRWGWWGWPPADLVCGTIATSDGLLWSQNVIYLVVEAPADSTAEAVYTLTVTVSDYSP